MYFNLPSQGVLATEIFRFCQHKYFVVRVILDILAIKTNPNWPVTEEAPSNDPHEPLLAGLWEGT